LNKGCRRSLAETSPSKNDAPAIADANPQGRSTSASTDPDRSVGIDKSLLAVAAPRRYRNREHLRYVAKQPCLICGRRPSDPHHLRYLQPRALGRRASDEFAVPLCRSHHRAVHRARDERTWWRAVGVNPDQVARKLWKDTRIDEGQIAPDPTAQAAPSDRSLKSDADAVETQAAPPVRFRRPAGMLPLPVPQQGGSIEALNSFLNLSSRNDFVLIVAWLPAALRPGGPYPLLAISGEQGSAKTVLSKLLKALIDPNVAPVRALSREERELMIAANNGYLLAFDNLSGLPNWLSDALCRLASGGSFAVRRLYTDDEEVLFQRRARSY
jgi:hypothetical protein